MLASLCVERINESFCETGQIFLDDEQLFKAWQQIYHYFRSADTTTIQRIVEDYRIQCNHDDLVIMVPLQIRMGNLKLNHGIRAVSRIKFELDRLNLGNITVQTIKFLQSIKKNDGVTIVDVDCHYYLDCASLFSNLKVLQLDDCRSDDELRCVSRECPLLEKVICQKTPK